MKFQRFIIALCILLFCLALSLSVSAQAAPPDETPEVTDAVIVVEATEAAPVVEVTAEPAPAVEPVETLSPAIAAYRDIVIFFGAFVTTVLIVLTGVIGGLIKTNSTIAKYAAENVPQATFDKATAGTEYLQGLAKTLTPNWTVDDKVLAGVQQQLAELRAVIYPNAVTTATVTTEGNTKTITAANVPPGWVAPNDGK